MSLVPFVVFIVITIGLSFINAADLNMMIASGVIGLIVGMLIVKDKPRYWDIVLEGLGDKMAMTAVLIWLVVGIYGSVLKSGHLVAFIRRRLLCGHLPVFSHLCPGNRCCLWYRGSHELYPVSGRYPDGMQSGCPWRRHYLRRYIRG